MQNLRPGVSFLLAAAVLAGCSSTPTSPPAAAAPAAAAAPGAGTAPAAAPNPNAARPVASSTVATVAIEPHLDANSAISKERSVYFGFDDFSIRTEYLKLVERHGNYLAVKPALSIRVEGSADERGSPEYNLALGQKRAQAVLQALKTYGVKDGQMEAVSWGEERPKATGHDEAAWAENRRADILYSKR